MSALRLVLFDVDGTLVNSQGDIIAAMRAAFAGCDLAPPTDPEILSIVGLSLDVAMRRLAPSVPDMWDVLVEGYKHAYMTRRAAIGAAQSSPLYAGAADALARIATQDHVLLGVATGKSRRGLDKLLEGHGMADLFITQQVADDHPSKPNPSMIHAAMRECGVDAGDTVMIGDTSFDMEMAKAAGAYAIGVAWGYHDVAALALADIIITDYAELDGALAQIWGQR